MSFGGLPADGEIGHQLLRVVQPAAVEAAMTAHEEDRREGDEVVEALRRDLDDLAGRAELRDAEVPLSRGGEGPSAARGDGGRDRPGAYRALADGEARRERPSDSIQAPYTDHE